MRTQNACIELRERERRQPAVVDETWHGVRDVTVNVRVSLRCVRIGQTIYALKNSYLNIVFRVDWIEAFTHAARLRCNCTCANFAAWNLYWKRKAILLQIRNYREKIPRNFF